MKKTAKLTFWNEGKVDWLIKVFLITLLVFAIAPFLVTINLSLKSVSQFEYDRWEITAPFEWANYKDAFKAVKVYIANSIIISFLSAIGVVLLSAIGGYAFARGKFPLKEPIFIFIIAGLMIPGVLYLVPKFVLYRNFNLINTRWALLVSYWVEGQIFGIFLFRSYFESLPEGLYDAAEIDGAGIWGTFWHIALPLGKPIAGTLVIINVMFTWNDIIWPWVAVSDNNLRTISIGLSIFQRSFLYNSGGLFAGYVIASIPLIVLFVFTSRYFISGLTSEHLKHER